MILPITEPNACPLSFRTPGSLHLFFFGIDTFTSSSLSFPTPVSFSVQPRPGAHSSSHALDILSVLPINLTYRPLSQRCGPFPSVHQNVTEEGLSLEAGPEQEFKGT